VNKSVIINLGSGDLYQGFPRVTMQLWTADNPRPEQFIGTLPANPTLVELHRNWQLMYQGLCARIGSRQPDSNLLDDDLLEISSTGITHISQVDFDELCEQIHKAINDWLKSEGFLTLEYQMRSKLDLADLIRVIIETNDLNLRYLPWHLWAFFADYPKAEIALAQPVYQSHPVAKIPFRHQKVRILAILGNSVGIDLAAETRLLQRLQDAEVIFLVNPSRQQFNEHLWQTQGWDILFFAGHSQTQEQTGHIYINENIHHNSLTIAQLQEALKAAIGNGLKLAIFNSCDGLGLAQALEKLYMPNVVVMREPVPNQVAQEFFQQFLTGFALEQLPLYLAVQQARRKLQGLEDRFPAASWLPIICQNLAVEPPTWLQLGGSPPCPYRGLFAFREKDAAFFFGRTLVIQALLTAVKQQPLIALIGASGSGKSSVVFAGLIPLLRQELTMNGLTTTVDRSPQIVSFRPGNNPLAALASSLAQSAPITDFIATIYPDGQVDRPLAAYLEQQLRQNPQQLSQLIESVNHHNAGSRLILIADQFEELYTLCPEAERQECLDLLIHATITAPAFTLILTLRADFCGHALAYRPLSEILQGAIHVLGPMNSQELQEAIERPAAQIQVSLEQGLVQKLILAVNGKPGRLPLLEFALTQLWANQRAGRLTHQAYDEIGGVEEALANHAEMVYSKLKPAEQLQAKQIFVQLIQPGFGTEDIRRCAERGDLPADAWDLVARLASSRLVVTNCDEATGQETVEIVHEALIEGWKRLHTWMQVDGEFRRWQEQLRSLRRQWQGSDRDDGSLLRGKALTDAGYWLQDREAELSEGEQDFIQRSLILRDREMHLHKRRQQITIGGLIGGIIAALGLTLAIGWQWHKARISEVEALSKSSEALFATNKQLEALVEAIRAKRSLQSLGGTDPITQNNVDLALMQAAYGLVEYNRISINADGLKKVLFSPDGKILATVLENNTIQLWNIDGTLRTTLVGHQGGVNGISFSPNGKTIASAASDRTIKIWQLDGTLIKTITGHQAAVDSISFSPNGQFLASASSDKTIKLWSSSGTLLTTLNGHQAEVTHVAFSPDAQRLASVANDKSIKLWKMDGTLQHTLVGHKAEVTDVSFSRDGHTIASASADKTIKLWRDNGTEISTLEGHNDVIWSLSFSPDGQSIASASWDSTVRFWHYKSPLLTILAGHSSDITGVSFSPDGQTIASAGDDKTVKLWSIDGTMLKTLTGHRGRVYHVSFSPNGQTLVSASEDTTIKLWNLEGELLRTIDGNGEAVWDVRYSPDGQTIISAGDDKIIKLWNLEGKLLQQISGHAGAVLKAMYSKDGQQIITSSNDKTIRFWDLDGKLLKTIGGHNGKITAMDVSPMGQHIASGANDKTIMLWNREGSLQKTLYGHQNMVQGIAFSPDGMRLASASADGTVKLWATDGTLLKTLKRHSGAVWGIDYSPNGQTIASSSADGRVILWNIKQLLALDELTYACDQIQDYLRNNSDVKERDRAICKKG
jgi:WD40 repeat protein